MQRYPDIEIYAHDITFKQIDEWLKLHFKQVEKKETISKKSQPRCSWIVDGSDVVVFGNATGKYSSIWFKQNNSPWDTDLDCARIASQQLNTQVRCSNSSWQEGQAPESQWWRVTEAEGEMLIEWSEN